LLIVPVIDNIYRLVHIRQTLFKCLKRAQIKMDAISCLFLVTICRTAIGPPIRTNLSQKNNTMPCVNLPRKMLPCVNYLLIQGKRNHT
jgi:hypothetical protein